MNALCDIQIDRFPNSCQAQKEKLMETRCMDISKIDLIEDWKCLYPPGAQMRVKVHGDKQRMKSQGLLGEYCLWPNRKWLVCGLPCKTWTPPRRHLVGRCVSVSVCVVCLVGLVVCVCLVCGYLFFLLSR